MNREQRRRGMQPTIPQPTMHQVPRQFKVETSLHHTDTEVVVAFSEKCENLRMTPAQVDSFIEGLQGAKAALLAHMAKDRANG